MHQTYCERDGLWHLKSEECPACDKRDLPRERADTADQADPAQSDEMLVRQARHNRRTSEELFRTLCGWFSELVAKRRT